MLYVLDEEEVSPLPLSAQGGQRESHRELQIYGKKIPVKKKGNDHFLQRTNL